MLTGKSNKPAEDLGADDVDEEPCNFTVYVQVWSPSALEKKPGKGGKTSTTIFMSKGPFKFDTLQLFAKFQIQVACILPCRLASLPISKFEWKFENQAQSAPQKKIATIAGYEALIDTIKAKQATENIIVWLYTPKPAKEEDDWDTGGADYVEHPFGFEKETSNGESTSAKGLIAEMSAKRGEAEALLTKEYPAGKFAIFPDKCVWQNKMTGSYFEITPLHIKIWANAILRTLQAFHHDVTTNKPACMQAAKMANVFAPPTSTHFTEDKKLKVPAAHPQAPGGGNGPGLYPPSHFMGFPPLQHFPPYYPTPYPPYMGAGYPYPSHSYPYPPPGPPAAPPHGFQMGAPTVPPLANIPSPFPSPSVTMRHNVSLVEFCLQYDVPVSDQVKLAALEYHPGNRAIETLGDKDWHEFAKFTTLGWKSFVDAHKKICSAMKAHNT
ncbi:hypothetical protein PAXRUDRAFT_146827 [Paxillus rubicundulus Ve08.2h10]|uniref:Uncharacterized protein n=1 Tax=Paxillus rubicundulus Ve08.2h10 TaxID=930991 RepID=A0A0D0DM71_9AGAM|nr:hypothetical protein PAXRUDRAFT_146827 [Paxillus rubicundulus Ve08.2h10]